jgi:predicted metal-binding membrane protein
MSTTVVSGLLSRDRAVVLSALVVAVIAAWAWLLLGAGIESDMMNMGGGQIMAMQPQWTPSYVGLLLLMWMAMMVAMMLPSAAPTILLVAALNRQRGRAAPRAAAFFAAGYLFVWFGFSFIATALEWALDLAGLLSATMALGNALVAGGVLVAAGVYQWTPLKDRCLSHCRSPLGFLIRHWRGGALGGLSSGARHGAFCLGCCWMLMALLFVGGVMNLTWIGAIALLVLVEKTLPWGGRMSRVMGAVLFAWGAFTLALLA